MFKKELCKDSWDKMNKKERNDLIISWLTISLAFAWLIKNVLSNILPFPNDFAMAIPIAIVGVGTGFVFHEMGHRQVAKHFGAHAEFRAWNTGLIIAIISAVIFRFIFAAPGAVYIYGPHLTRKQNGLISLAGPLTNIIIATIAFATALFTSGFIELILMYTAMINLFLAFFNMLPIPPLDGSKVMAWDVRIWAAIFFPLLVVQLFTGF